LRAGKIGAAFGVWNLLSVMTPYIYLPHSLLPCPMQTLKTHSSTCEVVGGLDCPGEV